jgi:hypothetical protein
VTTFATYGKELTVRDHWEFRLAPDAVPKLVLMALLVAILVLWIRGYLSSLDR